MTITAEIQQSLDDLDRVFHNEHDFQIEFARQLNKLIDGFVRPEFPLDNPLLDSTGQTYIDVLCFTEGDTIAIELKYPRATFHAEATPQPAKDMTETFDLRDVDAYDMAMYPFWKDLETLERLVASNAVDEAYVLQLTNYKGCWSKQNEDLNGADFLMHEDRVVSDRLAWTENTSERTKQSYPAVELSGTYRMQWNPYTYSYPKNGDGSTEFRYLLAKALSSD
jgi:hypothetical protein